MTTPDQSIIAGGISKINTVDNYISIYMSPEMRLKGEMLLYYLKTRSSSAVGSMTQLAFNPDNLIISDNKDYIEHEESVQGAYNSVKIESEDSKNTINLADDTDIWDRPKTIKISGITENDLDDFFDLINR